LDWIRKTDFPKVFKLRGGAGASNVKLIRTKEEAAKIVTIAFGKGFKNYDAWGSIKERFRKWRIGKADFTSVLKGVIRLVYPPLSSKVAGREIGYVYFQEFMTNNQSDTRIIVIDEKAFALKRFVRMNDFRASGSGNFAYNREEFDERCIQIAFDTTSKIKSQCGVYDFVFDVNKVEEKYYLSDKVRDYVLSSGTKTFKTSVKTDLEVARPLLQSMHKMHRAGVDNYVTHTGRIRKLTPKEFLRLMGFRDDFKQVVSDTQMYRQAGNSIVVDVLIALLKQMDITKFAK
jgi:hypothetical protein